MVISRLTITISPNPQRLKSVTKSILMFKSYQKFPNSVSRSSIRFQMICLELWLLFNDLFHYPDFLSEESYKMKRGLLRPPLSSHQRLRSKVARWQNLIPSFPWIAPGWRAWGRNPRKGRDQILQHSVAEP